MKRFNLFLREDTIAELESRAGTGTSVAALIRQAVDAFLSKAPDVPQERPKPKPAPPSPETLCFACRRKQRLKQPLPENCPDCLA